MPRHKAIPYAPRTTEPPADLTFVLDGAVPSFSATCTECNDRTGFRPQEDLMVGVVSKGWRWGSGKKDPVPEEWYMQCQCPYPHAGDTAEDRGCGAGWWARRSPAGTA